MTVEIFFFQQKLSLVFYFRECVESFQELQLTVFSNKKENRPFSYQYDM